MRIIPALLLLALAAPSFGQVSVEEAQARLKTKQAQRATQPSAPAARPVAPAAAVKPGKTVKRLALKYGAPPRVAEWFSSLPLYRQGILDGIRERIEEQEKAITAAEKEKIPLVRVGGGQGGPEMRPDERAQRERNGRVREMKKKIVLLNKQIQEIKDDPMSILKYPPDLTFKEGNYGSLKEIELRVVQVVDGSNVMVKMRDKRVIWISGFSTAGLVEDELVVGAPLVICTGKKQYTTASGAKTTVFVVEPLDVEKWVGVEEVPVPPPARLDPVR
jgi:hypothetical protein